MRFKFIVLTILLGCSLLAAPSTAKYGSDIAGSTYTTYTFRFPPQTHTNTIFRDCKVFVNTPYVLLDIINKHTYNCREQWLLTAIAHYESTFNSNAKNRLSTASGMYQYLDSTWLSHGCGQLADKTDIDKSVKCALQDIRKGLLKQWEVWKRV